jgi:hypothetical protein
MVRQKIARCKTDAAVAKPRKSEDTSIQCQDREFDNAHTPSVDKDIDESNLADFSMERSSWTRDSRS